MYAKDAGGLVCSGNPTASGEVRCASNPNDQKEFTCSPSPSPTPQVCAAPSLTVNRTCNGANSTDALSWDTVSSCSWYQITWGNDDTPADWPTTNNFAASSPSKSFTGINGNTQQCYRVKCTTASACNATGVQSGIVCKAACPAATSTPVPTSCGGSIPANAESHDDEESQSPIPLGTNWTYAASDGGNTKCQYKCASGYVRSGTACVAPTTAPSACGGSIPSGAEAHDDEESQSPIPSETNWTYRANDNAIKCQFKCASGYMRNGSVCEPSTCATPSTLICGGSCDASGEMKVSCTFDRDTRVTHFVINYDDDDGFGNDSSTINTTQVTNTAVSVSYDSTTTFPNKTHWYRIKNLTSDGTCTVGTDQYTDVVSAGPATCGTYACTGGTTPPASNYTVCTNDQTNLSGNTQWKNVSASSSCTGGANNKCQWYCNSGYSWNGSSCVADGYACTGTRPVNTLYYNGDDEPTGSDVSWAYAATNTAAKCEYTCDTGYSWNSSASACELPANACSAPVISGAITCDADGNGMLTGSWAAISGANEYRYRRNTSSTTTGAFAATLNATSFSVPIDDPTVTNYFQVRVQKVTNSATCTDPGSWSAWKAVDANTSCTAPTATPAVTTCVAPSTVTVSESCSPNPQIGASWDKVFGALRYEYQIRRAGARWADRVSEGEVDQPLGSVDPVMPAYFTEVNPPDYSVRVRSVCSDGAGGEVTSAWQTDASNFNPSFCGGPTPTPPSYDATIKFYKINAANQCRGTTALDVPLTNAQVRVRNSTTRVDRYESFSGNEATIRDLDGTGVNRLTPSYSTSNPDYVIPACEDATINLSSAPVDALGNPVDQRFYLSKVEGPWWQSSFGDVYGETIISQIPVSTTHLSVSGSGSDAGAVIWSNPPTLGSVLQVNASEMGYQDKETMQLGQDYSHFDAMLTASPVASVRQTNTGTYKVPGSATVDALWSITGNNKVTVIVPGNLTINHNITVQEGSFLFVVVNGTITIAHNVSEINGIFLAKGAVTIESGRNATPQADDVKLSARGSVISFGDITSLRSLPGSDNNGEPATEFIYRPDLIINTPDSLRSKSTTWQEVAP